MRSQKAAVPGECSDLPLDLAAAERPLSPGVFRRSRPCLVVGILAAAGGFVLAPDVAAVYQIARDFGNAEIFMGARTAERLYFLEESKQHSTVHVSTDDGSLGFHGRVTEQLRERLAAMTTEELAKLVFYNCGPEPMVHAAIAVEREFCSPSQIYSAIDYHTKCGVGICGACNAPDGRRLCVDGPFLQCAEN